MRGVSSRVAADLQPSGLRECRTARQNSAARDLGIGFRPAEPRAGKAAMAKLVRVIATMLAIVAGPGLAGLVEGRLTSPAQYGLHLRGSIAFDGDFVLRGSIKWCGWGERRPCSGLLPALPRHQATDQERASGAASERTSESKRTLATL